MNSKGSPQENRESSNDQKPGQNWSVYRIIFLVLIVFIFYQMFNASGTGKSITWKKFEALVRNRNVERVVVVNNIYAEVYLKKADHSAETKQIYPFQQTAPDYEFNIGAPEVLEEKLESFQSGIPENERIEVSYTVERNWFGSVLIFVISFVVFFFLWRWIIRSSARKTGSLFSFGKSGARLFENDETNKITFRDVAGLDEAKGEMEEIVDFLRHPQNYTSLGAKIPKGILIAGPPGTGKTLLAKAVAGEARVAFLSLSGSEFVELFVGIGASRVRDLFRRAKEKAPCIVFIDEIDAIGRIRGAAGAMNSNDERENTLNQLLAEMDGFGLNLGVIVLAATNRAEILDRALLRPGRFDRHINLELPDLRERKEIFLVHMSHLKVDKEVDAELLASECPGFSGADIANVCNEAALVAARKKRQLVISDDFSDAFERIVGGLEKRKKIVSPRERRIVAFHEAGHALATAYLKGLKEIVKVTIIPRGKSMGAAWYRPEELQLITLSQLKNEICILLAGRVAEEVTFDEISSGALDDLEKATRQAYSMIAYYGLSKKIGPLSFFDSTGSKDNPFQKPYSEETARTIDEEVRNLLNECYEKVKSVLISHRPQLEQVGELLLEKEIIRKEDLERIVNEEKEGK
jgi:AFG3 family protein